MVNEIDRRLSAGNASFWAYRKLWVNRGISEKIKVRIYAAVVRSILLYASDSWCLSVADKRKLEIFDRRKLCWITGIKWNDEITNTELYKMEHTSNKRDNTAETLAVVWSCSTKGPISMADSNVRDRWQGKRLEETEERRFKENMEERDDEV